MLAYDDLGYIMTATTPGEDVMTESGQHPDRHSTGLVAGHSYSLLACKTVSSGHRLVQLRNPWGSLEWNGDWSDESSLWEQYPEVKRELSVELDDNDGTFWMSFEALCELFVSVTVCFLRNPILNKKPW
jgi:hypothetical protein